MNLKLFGIYQVSNRIKQKVFIKLDRVVQRATNVSICLSKAKKTEKIVKAVALFEF